MTKQFYKIDERYIQDIDDDDIEEPSYIPTKELNGMYRYEILFCIDVAIGDEGVEADVIDYLCDEYKELLEDIYYINGVSDASIWVSWHNDSQRKCVSYQELSEMYDKKETHQFTIVFGINRNFKNFNHVWAFNKIMYNNIPRIFKRGHLYGYMCWGYTICDKYIFKTIADLVPPPTGDAEEIYYSKIRSYDKYQKLAKVLLGHENDTSFQCPFTDIYKKFGFTFDDQVMRKLRKTDYPSYKYIPIDLGNGDKPITFKITDVNQKFFDSFFARLYKTPNMGKVITIGTDQDLKNDIKKYVNETNEDIYGRCCIFKRGKKGCIYNYLTFEKDFGYNEYERYAPAMSYVVDISDKKQDDIWRLSMILLPWYHMGLDYEVILDKIIEVFPYVESYRELIIDYVISF